MKNIIKKILQEERNNIRLVKDVYEPSSLEKEFNINLNTNHFMKKDETMYHIFDKDEKVGYLVLSTEKYNDYNFQELLGGNVVYLNFIRTNKQGLLRDIIEELKQELKNTFDFIVLEVDGHDYNIFKALKQKYESVGFIGIMPDNVTEYDLGLAPEIDPYEEDVFMYTKI